MQARLPRIGLVALAALGVMLFGSVLAEARVFKGTGKANRVAGTKKADKMNLKGGNDRARGKAGADRISGGAGNDRLRGDAGNDRVVGGKGRDRLHGGKGRDRLSGGAGNDVLNAADKRKDAVVSGGGGKNTCKIDAVDLSVVKGCGKLVTVPSGGSGPGSGGPGAGGGLGGPGGPGGGGGSGTGALAIQSADGLQCASDLPTCTFTLSGTGADSLIGTVSGGGGVTTLGGSLAAQGEDWSAAGLYGCTADGYLRVTIGSEQLDVPVDCQTTG
jgi:RTX calcium-binding nonapeptide repeat (4 copies)